MATASESVGGAQSHPVIGGYGGAQSPPAIASMGGMTNIFGEYFDAADDASPSATKLELFIFRFAEHHYAQRNSSILSQKALFILQHIAHFFKHSTATELLLQVQRDMLAHCDFEKDTVLNAYCLLACTADAAAASI